MVVAGAKVSPFHGPHIAFLPGRVTCPLAGVGTRAASASNRLVVDDPATGVTIEGTTISLTDDRGCAPKTAVADFVWLAEGPAPFTIHLEVFKSGHSWSIDLHTHEPVALGDRHVARYEPFTIVAIDNGRREVLVEPAQIARAVGHVPLSRRLSSKLMTMRDHRRDGDPALFDRSIGIGALGRGSFLVRARLAMIPSTASGPSSASDSGAVRASSTSGAAVASGASGASSPRGDRAKGSLVSMLADGEWELSIEALTDRFLPEIVARDLALYGLADIPLLADLRAGKMRRGQTLAFRTTGEVRLDDRTAPLIDARDLARTYIEFHMLGGIIAAALR